MSERYLPRRYYPPFEVPNPSKRDFLKILAKGGSAALLGVCAGVTIKEKFFDQKPESEIEEKEIESLLIQEPQVKEEVLPKEVPVQEPKEEVKIEMKEAANGAELIRNLGLGGKVVDMVYGRPPRYDGQPSWGSLGDGKSNTAEESWASVKGQKERVGGLIGKEKEDFAYTVLNPVYESGDGFLERVYIKRALELAEVNQGIVALGFNNTSLAKQTLEELEMDPTIPRELLGRLSVSLDVEHFKDHTATSGEINEFTAWYAQKHREWSGDSNLPGLVFVYVFQGETCGKLENLPALEQYYLKEKTLVPLIFDGFGTAGAKFTTMAEMVKGLPNDEENPALVGVMEFRLKWGDLYDKDIVAQIYETLKGAPVFWFASQ